MHIAIVIDEERLAQEQSMLNRLCIGLMAEGIRVTRIVPDSALPDNIDSGEQRVALAKRIEAPMRVLPWMRRSRTVRLAERLEKHVPNILYAVGQNAWKLALDLSAALQCSVLIDVCSAQQVRSVPRPSSFPAIAGYVACTGALARMLSQHVARDLVSLVPMGVAVPSQPREVLINPADGEQQLSLAVLGSASHVQSYEPLLNGLKSLMQAGREVQIFLELSGPREHEIWKAAERLDLLRFISTIGDASLYRALVTRCDMVLLPEPIGKPRSIVLEAMARAMPVIAAEDPVLDMLIDGETAVVIDSDVPERWAEHLLGCLDQPGRLRTIGAQGRQMVASHHRSSDQVNWLVQTLERVMHGGAMAFPARQS